MVDLNTFVSSSDGDIPKQGFFNGIANSCGFEAAPTRLKYVGQDHTANTSTGGDTEIAEYLIPGGTVVTGIIIIATAQYARSSGGSGSVAFYIRTGTSATGTSNTLRKQLGLWSDSATSSFTAGTIFIHLTTEEDWTTDTYVHITATGTNGTTTNRGLLVVGY